MTMADFRTNLTAEVINEIKRYFNEKVYASIIPRNIRLSEAPSHGKPITLYDPTSIGAKRYRELAAEVLKANDSKWLGEKNVQKMNSFGEKNEK